MLKQKFLLEIILINTTHIYWNSVTHINAYLLCLCFLRTSTILWVAFSVTNELVTFTAFHYCRDVRCWSPAAISSVPLHLMFSFSESEYFQERCFLPLLCLGDDWNTRNLIRSVAIVAKYCDAFANVNLQICAETLQKLCRANNKYGAVHFQVASWERSPQSQLPVH